MFVFLYVRRNKEVTLRERLGRIDVVGNLLIVASTSSILIPLTWAGSRYAWSAWQTLLPLFLGLGGFGGSVIFKGSSYCHNPVIPPGLFANRTAAAVYVNTFINSMMLYWVTYFLPIYFQAVLLSSPSKAESSFYPLSSPQSLAPLLPWSPSQDTDAIVSSTVSCIS